LCLNDLRSRRGLFKAGDETAIWTQTRRRNRVLRELFGELDPAGSPCPQSMPVLRVSGRRRSSVFLLKWARTACEARRESRVGRLEAGRLGARCPCNRRRAGSISRPERSAWWPRGAAKTERCYLSTGRTWPCYAESASRVSPPVSVSFERRPPGGPSFPGAKPSG